MKRAHDTRSAKRTCCQSGKGRFAACRGRNSTGIFFLFIFIQQFKYLFILTFVSRPVDSTISENVPGGGDLLPYFCYENAPGAVFRNCFMVRPVYSVPYGISLPLAVLHLTPAVTNASYSVNHKHHDRYW